MGFFDGFGKHLSPRRRRNGFGISSDPNSYGTSTGFDSLAADADATRIRLSDHVHENVSRLPPPPESDADDGPKGKPMPDDKPDPRAQWDGVRGVWILWDPTQGAWVDLERST